LVGCGATNVERKTTGGIGLGALAGGLITGKPGSAIAGAAVGGLAGYAIGTDQDRHAEKMALEREQNEIAKAKITSDPKTAYRPPNRNDLLGTTWRVISIEGEQPLPEYHSLVTTFQANSKVTTFSVLRGWVSTQVYQKEMLRLMKKNFLFFLNISEVFWKNLCSLLQFHHAIPQ